MSKTKKVFQALSAAAALTLSSTAFAAVERTFCVFDIIGASGDTYNMMKDYKTAALAWGVDVELKPYTDEKIASEISRPTSVMPLFSPASAVASSTATPAAWIPSAPFPATTPCKP